MTLRTEVEAALEAGPLSTPEVAERVGHSVHVVREVLGGLYTRRAVDRERAGNGRTWVWRMGVPAAKIAPAPPSMPAPPEVVASSRSTVPVLARGEDERVAVRVRRMLAARRGRPEPMSGALSR